MMFRDFGTNLSVQAQRPPLNFVHWPDLVEESQFRARSCREHASFPSLAKNVEPLHKQLAFVYFLDKNSLVRGVRGSCQTSN